MAARETEETVAQGVEALIARLRDEGVEAGRAEAGRLIDEARQRRREIIADAETEAQRMKDAARDEVALMKANAHQALDTAARDAVLALREQIVERFKQDIRRLVSKELREEDVFRRLILSIAAETRAALETAGPDEVLIELPRHAPGLDEIRRDPDAHAEDELSRLVVAMTGDILREGVRFRVSRESQDGIRVVAGESGLEFDMTDAAVAELIGQHLQPRFRALLEGVLR